MAHLNNGFFRRYILKVQEAYACIIHSVVTDQHIFHAISKSCMNVVTDVCQTRTSMHAHSCAFIMYVQRVKCMQRIDR